eukprot:7381413-Prymnesium_polylepis.3
MARRSGCISVTNCPSSGQKDPSTSTMTAFNSLPPALERSNAASVTRRVRAARLARCHSAHATCPFHSRVFPGFSGALSLPWISRCNRLSVARPPACRCDENQLLTRRMPPTNSENCSMRQMSPACS